MTKEQTEVCEKLADSEVSSLAERYDGRYHPRIVGKSWFIEGFQAAQAPEMLMLNPLVQKLINAVKLSKGAFEQDWNIDWNELDRAIAPFKDGE